MKTNSQKEILKVDKVFTDRKKPRDVFWDTYNQFQTNIDNGIDNDIKVITYYGIGGIGKTRLLEELKNELKRNIHKPKFVYHDLEKENGSREVIEKLRNKLIQEYGFSFPILDLAIYAYAKKLGDKTTEIELEGIISKSKIVSSIFDMCGGIPLVGFVPTILKGLDSFVAATRNYIIIRKEELSDIQEEEPYTILKNLSYYFSLDLADNVSRIGEPLVVFLDTYETLVNEISSIGDALDKDEWLRNEEKGLITNIPNVIWVIAGRESLKWNMFNPEWIEVLDQHLLGDLSDDDTEYFLEKAGITDSDLQKDIYTLTKGVPIYIDLCVDRYYSILYKDIKPTIKDIGENTTVLVQRFIKYMDDINKELIYILSCLEEWTDESLNELRKKYFSSIPYVTIDRIKGYSFIITIDTNRYSMHQTVIEIINASCPESIRKDVEEYLNNNLVEKLERMSPIEAEHITVLKKYLLSKIKLVKNVNEFEKYFHDILMKEVKKLNHLFQYEEAISLFGLTLKNCNVELGEKKILAEFYFEYSKALDNIFIGREKSRGSFWNVYNQFQTNIRNGVDNDIKVIHYYGIGGIGKTRLLKELKKELVKVNPNSKFVYHDFDTENNVVGVIKKLRNKLVDYYRFSFPIFDLAIYMYVKKLGDKTTEKELEGIIYKSKILSSIFDTFGGIPIVGFDSTVLKELDSLDAATRNYIIIRKEELSDIQEEEPDTILKNLPYYFSLDLADNVSRIDEPLVVFLDTYETLVNEISSIGDALDKDEWLRNIEKGLITNIPNVIWVIAGRERLKWNRFNPEWEEILDQHLLGDLSDDDTEYFLEKAGITDSDLQKDIYTLTKGVPIYIDVWLHNYHSILAKGIQPPIQDIGENTTVLVQRFIKYMDDINKELIYILSCLEEWTDESLNDLMKKLFSSIPISRLARIKGYSFIINGGNNRYCMHQTLKKIAYEICPEVIKKEVEEYLHNNQG